MTSSADPSLLVHRLTDVRQRIADAARAAGRDATGITLVAVSKTHPAEAVREAYAAGVRDFGENYVQEFVAKRAALADLTDLRWHFIGHLQTNKARAVAGIAFRVHTVDSVRLAVELGRRSHDAGRRLDCLVEVNVGGEGSKSGCAPADVPAVLDAVAAQPALSLCGLMTVPPHTEDPQGAAVYFNALRSLRDQHGGPSRLPELSMGMSHDLTVAVAHGATVVRVGTAIFGARGG